MLPTDITILLFIAKSKRTLPDADIPKSIFFKINCCLILE